jgi:hypothetical protein
VGEKACVICGDPLPQGDHGANRRRYCGKRECRRAAQRIAYAEKVGHDPAAKPLAPKTVEKVAALKAAPRVDSRTWRVYWELVEQQVQRLTREDLQERLGGTRQRAHTGLVHLQHLGLLRWDGAEKVFVVEPPRSSEAAAWLLREPQR